MTSPRSGPTRRSLSPSACHCRWTRPRQRSRPGTVENRPRGRRRTLHPPPPDPPPPAPPAAPGAPAGGVPPEVDQRAREAEARAREQAEAAAEHDPPRPTGRVDRQAVWEALLRKAKEMKVSAPTGLLKSLTGGKTSLASMDDAEVLALAKKLQ